MSDVTFSVRLVVTAGWKILASNFSGLDLHYYPLVVTVFHASFAFFLVARILFSRHKGSHVSSKVAASRLGPMHKGAQWLCIVLFLLYGAPSLWSGWRWWQSGSTSKWTEETVFYVSQAVAWMVAAVALGREHSRGEILHSTSLRIWWIGALALSISGAVVSFGHELFPSFHYTFDLALLWLPPFLYAIFLALSTTGLLYKGAKASGELSEAEKPLLQSDASSLSSVQLLENGYGNAGWFSRLTFSWINPLLSVGNSKALVVSDIPLLDQADNGNDNYKLFQRCWEKQKLEALPGTYPSVWTTLWIAYRLPFISSLVIMFIWSTAIFVGPLLQNELIKFMNDEHRTPERGLRLVLILLAGKLIEGLAKHQFGFAARRLGLRMWAAVGCAVYRKTLKLSHKARLDRSVGEVTNILSTDVQRLLELTWYIQQGLAVPFQLTVAVAVLFSVVGMSMFAGLATLFSIMVVYVLVGGKLKTFRARCVSKKDERMQATSEMLGNMKVIKLQGWDERFRSKIVHIRDEEVLWLKRFTYGWTFTLFVTYVGPLAVSAATFLCMILVGEELTTARVFTTLTTIRIIQEPVRFCADIFSSLIQATVSLRRVSLFLCEDEIKEDNIEIASPDCPYAVDIENASFAWDQMVGVQAINNLSLKVEKGSCVAVCGGVGSGKSSLLFSILGELPKLSGTAKRSGRVAYVAQSAWIQNSTIRENILFGRALDLKRYCEAVRVSGLETDLAMMPEGDETEIGERGINMSGGQKQRVQLARAVYQDADIYLLDDPFSAVDAHTGTFLFQECIRGALMGKTVILVTHQVEFLPSTDVILVMKDGKVIQRGSYIELLEEGKDFGSFVGALSDSMDIVNQINSDSLNVKPDLVLGSVESALGTRRSSNKELMAEKGSFQNESKSTSVSTDATPSPSKGKLIRDEERREGRVDVNLLWAYCTKVHYGLATLAIVLLQITAFASQLGSDTWIAFGTKNGSPRSTSFIGIYALFILGCGLSVLIRACLTVYIGVKTAQVYYVDMLASILRAPMSFIDSTPLGRILSRSSSDQSAIDLDLPPVLSNVTNSAIGVFTALAVSAYVTPQILFLIVPLAYIYVKLQVYYIASARELARLTALTEAPVFLHLNETLTGATTIRALGESDRFVATSIVRFRDYQRSYFHNITATTWLGVRLESLAALVLSAAALLLVILPSNAVSPGMAGLSLSYGFSLSGLLLLLVNYCSLFETKMVSVERVSQYTNLPSEAPASIPDRMPAEDWPQAGLLELENLQIRYRPDSPLVLKGISCVIYPGEKVGVVGRTGSGKSTLIQALFRLIEPSDGRIFIDGVDITTIGLIDLRSKLGVIPQEPTLFEGTVRSNLDPFGTYSDRQLWEALEKCTLAQSVREKHQKLDSPVSEQGENWSVGERQLLCLGRALLRRARVLVLDEATASVDITTDAIIQNTIRQNFAQCTIINVAHRVPTVIDSDRVLVLDAGHLMENDSPGNLLSNENSLFSKLVREYTNRKNDLH